LEIGDIGSDKFIFDSFENYLERLTIFLENNKGVNRIDEDSKFYLGHTNEASSHSKNDYLNDSKDNISHHSSYLSAKMLEDYPGITDILISSFNPF
jgi:hypothetical protein